ncbi:glycosyltransferase family 4 protein [Tessaracoccus sp. Z1128]
MTAVTFAANRGEMGGGEVMLLAMAEATRASGRGARVVGPPGVLLDTAAARGFATVEIHGRTPVSYLRGLRRWAVTAAPEFLWCNGLRPALATSSLPRRVVHLHSLPSGRLRPLLPLATAGADDVLVPSEWLRRQLGVTTSTLHNWTSDLPFSPHLPPRDGSPLRLGFLGRLTSAKGAVVLADALRILQGRSPGRFPLVVGGKALYAGKSDATRVDAALGTLSPAPVRLGWVEPGDFFGQVDLAVFPSVAPESFGLVAVEAMAAGCPFVTTDAGALPSVTGHDPAFVAEAGNAEHLATTILDAVARYTPAHLEQSRRRWAELYSPSAGVARFTRYLSEWEERSA